MRCTFLLRAAALAAGLIFAAACGGRGDTQTSTTSGSGGGGGQGGSGAGGGLMPTGFKCSGTKVSYKTDVAPLFGAHCAGVEGCHVQMHDPATAYQMVVMQPNDECGSDPRKLVVPGDPEHSYVIQKITDTNVCSGSPMPKPLEGSAWTKLPDPLIQTIYDWICEGAKND